MIRLAYCCLEAQHSRCPVPERGILTRGCPARLCCWAKWAETARQLREAAAVGEAVSGASCVVVAPRSPHMSQVSQLAQEGVVALLRGAPFTKCDDPTWLNGLCT